MAETSKQAEQRRLAAALRENLKRRKQAPRARPSAVDAGAKRADSPADGERG